MTALQPPQPGSMRGRVCLLGPACIGKTTALRSLCGGDSHGAADAGMSTCSDGGAGAQLCEIDLGQGQWLQLIGCPCHEGFGSVRQWALSTSVGVLLMVDILQVSAQEHALRCLDEIAALDAEPVVIVLSCRPASGAQQQAFGAALLAAGYGVVPVIQADPRDRAQLLDALGVLVALLSLQSPA